MCFSISVVDDPFINLKVFKCDDVYSWLDMMTTISKFLKEGHSIHISCVKE